VTVLLLRGLVAAAGVGLLDGARVLWTDTLPMALGRAVAVLALDAAAMALLVALPLLLLLFLAGVRRSSGLGLWWGSNLGLLAIWGERWFTRPPPHSVVDPLHGAPWIFGLVAVVVLGAGLPLMRSRAVGPLAGLLALGVIWQLSAPRSLSAPGAAAPGAPDVQLITVDTLRADHVGAYGNPKVWTPAMDGLANAGARFSRASAQIAVTGPSHLTMLSGQGPWSHGVLLNGMPVPADIGWLPESMRAAGYRTGAFVSAYVLDGTHGFARGFEVYDDDFGWLQGWADTGPGRIGRLLGRQLYPEHVLERQGAATVEQALAWRRSVDGAPVFLWVHLFDPHGPYTPSEPWDTAYYEGDPWDPAHTSMAQVTGVPDYMLPSMDGITDVDWVAAQYAGEVSQVDQAIATLLEHTHGAQDAVVLLVGDHGESLGEHGVWFHHGGDLRTPELAVPMLLRYPAGVDGGTVVPGPVELTDVAATLAELAGIPAPVGGEGISLVAAAQTGRSPRSWSRGLCLDRPANLEARAAGIIDRPRYRVGSVYGRNTQLLSRDAPGSGVVRWEWREGQEVSVPLSILGAPPRPEIQEMLEAVDQLVGTQLKRTEERDAETMEKLRALGYIE